MGPSDLPENVYLPGQAQHEQKVSERVESTDPLDFESAVEILSRGAIREMRLPSGWVRGERKEREEERMYSYESFHPRGRPDVMLWFYYRGHRVSDAAAAAFRQMLTGPAQVLSPDEIRSVAEVIRDKSDPDDFRIVMAKTEEIGGRRILSLEGRYVDAQEDAYTLYADSGGSGEVVQEIHYRAPKADYLGHLVEAKAAFRSIVWK